MDGAFISLNAVAAPAAGSDVKFSVPVINIGMQVSFSSGGATVKVNLEGTIDGTNWFKLTVFDTAAAGASGDIVASFTIPVTGARANLLTVSAGTVTATLVARGGQG